MRFHRLDLIKYGKFSDRSVEFPAAKQDFHLIVGPNEAGKSTLRSAIVDLLFGIPSRSPLSFLHPLNELRLGACISNISGALEFHRAKALKQTLRTPMDVVLPDTALTAFLGVADRHFFDQMFGLDHTRLVEGGNSILNAQNDVGQVLFQSAVGIASLGKIRDALMAEADKLWAPRKSAERAYYSAADQLEKAAAALKETTVRTKVWAEANSKVENLHESLASERDRHQHLQGKRSGLERVRRLAPFLQTLKDAEKQLAELGHVVDLPIDAAAILSTAERELAVASQLLQLRNGEVEKAEGDLGEINVDQAVLEIAAEISKIDELRLQYSPYDNDIERQEMQRSALWRDVGEACVQLGWQSECEASLAGRLPTLLVRRELAKLTRDFSGLTQGLRAAEQAEKAKLAEIELLLKQLAELQAGEVNPALRAALASARSLGDPDTAIQKQQALLTRAQSALETSLQTLGQSHIAISDLMAMKPPSQHTLSRLLQDRHTLMADRKALLKRLEDQKTGVARIELEISQFKALHHLTTYEDVVQARRDRDASWLAIKTGEIDLPQGAQKFETTLRHADEVADTRLNNVEQITELQSLTHQLEREQQSLSMLENQYAHLNEELQQGDVKWLAMMQDLGLSGTALEDMGDWLAKREKVLAAAIAYRDAQDSFDQVSKTVAEFRLNLANALREISLQVAESDSLSALCVQAESFIKAVDGAKVRHETLSAQLQAAQTLATPLQQATDEAKFELSRWTQMWSNALVKSGLPEDSDIGTVEGALALIDQIEEKLKKIRLIQERIEVMAGDLKGFSGEADRLAQVIAPELKGQSAPKITQALAKRLTQARETAAEAARLKETLRVAKAQVVTAKESIQTATASLKPLMERAGVDTTILLNEAITRSDEHRRLKAQIDQAKASLVNGGDGLTRMQIEAEIDTADLVQLSPELTHITDQLSDAEQRQRELSVDHANSARVLSEIGGSDAAAQAEAQRQEALAKMSDVAERYVKVFTAGRLLRWSIDRYREEKQGPLLARAGAIFSKLTLGSFQRLVVDFEKEPPILEGLRLDGKLVSISGMSDGARDQLYLALRLASLEMHLQQAMPLPFIADDLFINYDDARAKAGFEALRTLSEQTQVIFLSHHDHLIPTVEEVFGKQVNVVVL
ncbi:conserved hypothetical protein [Crenothrix polyspora]|uniref:YhaN AAA domain-containing protein n=1 Tax=Crenothrix polyspora TaxID=360316 RepID=A0A1R4HGC9_9GAMM|nr:YhaN family protein [Crenothrix polyspora]SJM95274.1 conserved hypothetical protein [Crenothrix polyspora]